MEINFNDYSSLITNEFIDKYFFESFKKGEKSLELIVSPKCNLACKYCYIKDYSHKTYPEQLYDDTITLANIKLILNWLKKNKYYPDLELFSGELLAQNIGYKILDLMLNHFRFTLPAYRPKIIVIPTNFTFICSEELTKKVESYINAFKKENIRLFLSASFDGFYEENNRPVAHSLDIPIEIVRDENYYQKLAQFCLKYDYGFHPMLYSEGIENWIENFKWFKQLMIDNNIDYLHHLYLLEVRNKNWNTEQIQHFCKFLRYLYMDLWEDMGHDKDKIIDALFNHQGYNILSHILAERGNGISCGIQHTLHVRVADMKIFPCHRLMYPHLETGAFVYNEEKQDLEFQGKHPELNIVISLMNGRAAPRCVECEINEICIKGCLGSQYETTGDMFTPIPTVCNLEFAKAMTLIQCWLDTGVYDKILEMVTPQRARQIKNLREKMEVQKNGK